MTYIAHKNDAGGVQTVKEHSENTAVLSGEFAVDSFKPICRQIGLLHDVGKYQRDFQRRIGGDDSIRIEHSICGAKVAGEMYGKTALAHLMQCCIAGHHSGIPDCGTRADNNGDPTLFGRMRRECQDYSAYREELEIQKIGSDDFNALLTHRCGSKEEMIERFAFFVRYCFSCLTDADSIDTMRASGVPAPEELTSDFPRMKRLLEDRLGSFSGKTPLQKMRSVLQRQAFESAAQDAEIYLMNMPTGSGKTLAGMECALIRAALTGKRRIIYVIPYNSIIDQTVDTFEKLFGDRAQILRHQSSFSYEDMEDWDEDYRRNIKLVTENWDAQIIVTTAVQFFESLYANRRGKLRKLHNMAESVLIFDEAHLMPVDYLQPCLRAVAYITRFLRSEAIFLTATMPDFNSVIRQYALPDSVIRDLVPDKSGFAAFKKNTYTDMGKVSDEELLEKAAQYPSSLIVVGSRAGAKELYRLCTGRKFHLSTHMTAADRTRVIGQIRRALSELTRDSSSPEERVTVISTSLIEAGVDLDFDAAFRELGGLDNVLQTGGRCNREGLREKGDVFIFERDGGRYTRPEQNIMRGIMREFEDISSVEAVREYYRRLYTLKAEDITANSLGALCSGIWDIPFRHYSIKLIDDGGADSVMVPEGEEGQRLAAEMRSSGYANVRRIQKYCCSVSAGELDDLKRQNAVDDFGTGVFVLTNMDYYDPETGIQLQGKDIIF
ncbi:MAG: CRISPR-associated helicase Cas3' [Oscillospiraceae bacterium]|nr:CRISPR-associated helicase Cas3' [Oscillospiraceae bacterium]